MPADGSSGPLTWTNVIALVGLFLVIFGGGWTLFQTQISGLEHRLKEAQALSERRDGMLKEELQRRETELKAAIHDLQEELQRRRAEFVGHPEFNQFQKKSDDRWHTQADINRQTTEAFVSAKAWEVWRAASEQRLKHLEEMYGRITDDIHRLTVPPAKGSER